jgi:hypothetical protein
LALVSYLKAMTIQHTVELLRCMPWWLGGGGGSGGIPQ